VLAAGLTLAGGAFEHLHLPVYDWILYWSASRLTAAGENPYDAENLFSFQKAENPDLNREDTIIFYNPPWSLPLLLPFGLFKNFTAFRLVWGALVIAAIFFCSAWTWRTYEGPAELRMICLVATLVFAPVLHVMQSGQIGPLVLLGVVGFLCFSPRRQNWLAGAVLLLAAVKPHLLTLVWLALLLWTVEQRRWGILLGGLLAVLVATAVAWIFNPRILEEYWTAMRENSPARQWVTPTLGSGLRLVYRGLGLGDDWPMLQYIPTMLGFLFLPFYYLARRRQWKWEAQMPLLLFLSFLAAPYGAWVADMVVLLLPMIQAAACLCRFRPRWWPVAAAVYIGINGIAIWLSARPGQTWWFLWMAPALLVTYLLVMGRIARRPAVEAAMGR